MLALTFETLDLHAAESEDVSTECLHITGAAVEVFFSSRNRWCPLVMFICTHYRWLTFRDLWLLSRIVFNTVNLITFAFFGQYSGKFFKTMDQYSAHLKFRQSILFRNMIYNYVVSSEVSRGKRRSLSSTVTREWVRGGDKSISIFVAKFFK